MYNPVAASAFLASGDRLERASTMVDRARRWAAACTDASTLLDACDLLAWVRTIHREACSMPA